MPNVPVYQVKSVIQTNPENAAVQINRVHARIEELGWTVRVFRPKSEDFSSISSISLGLFPPFTTKRNVRVTWELFLPEGGGTAEGARQIVAKAANDAASGSASLADWSVVFVDHLINQPDIIKKGLETQATVVKKGADKALNTGEDILEKLKPWLIGGGILLGLTTVAVITTNIAPAISAASSRVRKN